MNADPKPRGRPRGAATPSRPQTTAAEHARASVREALNASLADYRSPCADDGRFIQDKIAPETESTLRALCVRCQAREACDKYASSERPDAGFWAGRSYGASRRTRTTN